MSSRLSFPLTPTFFGLTSNYKSDFLEEVGYCTEAFNSSFNETLKLPVYVRKYLIGMKIKSYQKRMESVESDKKKSSGVKTYSGDTLKEKINNKEIPL